MSFRAVTLAIGCSFALAACHDAIDVPADALDARAVEVVSDVAAISDAGSCCANIGATCGTPKACPGEVCGACGVGQTCGSANLCVAQVGNSLRLFGQACGPNAGCRPPADPSDTTALAAFHSCLNGQCADGLCDLGFCTKHCTITADLYNNATGAAGPDGIEDAASATTCSGAVSGPWGDATSAGSHFRCVQLAGPQDPNAASSAECLPESSFKPCSADADCDAGDACLIQFVYGQFRTICGPAMRTPVGTGAAVSFEPGGKLGAACNGDLANGALALCADDFCAGGGYCYVACKSDDDCVNAPGACSGGQCANGKACQKDADCSAFFCKPDVVYASDPAFSLSVCVPRNCAVDADCGAGSFCRPYWNGVKTSQGAAFAPQCQTIAAGTVKPGATCDPYATSAAATAPGALCQNPFACVDGNCGSLCQKDGDCTANQRCGVEEFVLDVDNPQGSGVSDGIPDFGLSLDICAYLPGASGPCSGQKDCTTGSAAYCKPFLHRLTLPAGATPVGQDTLDGVCVMPDGNARMAGAPCGAIANDAYCASGYCLDTLSPTGIAQAGYCADLCNGRDDCPSTIVNGDANFKTFCRSLRLGLNDTLDDDRDDIWLPYCQPTALSDSLQDCSVSKKCSNSSEQCLAAVIATGPDSGAKVEFVCVGVDPTASHGPGDVCDPKSSAASCKSPVGCLRDSAGAGYCSALCSQDGDCGTGKDGMFCDKANQLLPRVDPGKAVVVPICKKAKSCVACDYDSDCASTYACTNLAPAGVAAQSRCAPVCSSDTDCAGTDGGGKCVDALYPSLAKSGRKVCAPLTCP